MENDNEDAQTLVDRLNAGQIQDRDTVFADALFELLDAQGNDLTWRDGTWIITPKQRGERQ